MSKISYIVDQKTKHYIDVPPDKTTGENTVNLQGKLFVSLQPFDYHKQNKAYHQRNSFGGYYPWN